MAQNARILVLADPLDNQHAGIHVYTREWLRALDNIQSGNKYYVARLNKTNEFKNITEIVLPMPELLFGGRASRLFFQLPALAREIGADIVVEPAHFGPFMLPAHIKRVTVIHDLTPVKFPHWHRFHSQMAQRLLLKSILRKASLIVTNSKATSADLIEYANVAPNRVAMVYPGVTPFLKVEAEPRILLNYGIDRPYFFFAGTIEPRKNLRGLLRAYQLFREQTNLDHQLVLTGAKGWKSGSFFDDLSTQPFQKDIILTGYVPAEHLQLMYAGALAFVFPSFYEGFGFPVVEAMKCGCPVLCSNAGSLPEAGGPAALYFDPADHDLLARLMKHIAEDESSRSELIEKGFSHAERFNWENMAHMMDEHFTMLFSGQ